MVRKKLRTVFLLFKNNSKGKEKGKNVRKKVRTLILLFQKIK